MRSQWWSWHSVVTDQGTVPLYLNRVDKSCVLITRSIDRLRKSEVMNQVQGPSWESSQEQQEMEPDTGLEAGLQHGSAGDRTQGKLPTM